MSAIYGPIIAGEVYILTLPVNQPQSHIDRVREALIAETGARWIVISGVTS